MSHSHASLNELPGIVKNGKDIDRFRSLLNNPHLIKAEKCRRSFYYFVQEFFDVICQQEIIWNWHIKYLCDEAEKMAWRVVTRQRSPYDLIINIPPGTTKSTIFSEMLPAWVWTTKFNRRFYTTKTDYYVKAVSGFFASFICASYSGPVSLSLAQKSLDIVSSEKYKLYFPELRVREEKGARSSFQIQKYSHAKCIWINGGERFATSIGGSATGMHADFIIVDDPLNPKEAASDSGVKTANEWMTETIPTRKTDKAVTPIILVMQRLHQADPTGNLLENRKDTVKHIKLPALKITGTDILPKELEEKYVNGLLDPVRLSNDILKKTEADLGQYAFHAQFQQEPTPPQGGMFKIKKLQKVEDLNGLEIKRKVRYWDKAGSDDKNSAWTVGVLMAILADGRFIVLDVKRRRYKYEQRERFIRRTAEQDGSRVAIWIEQEGGSGGKESAASTIKNLAGYSIRAETCTGDKVTRADPYSVQVNEGNVLLLDAEWNQEYLEELRFFPYSKYKDQVDASAGAFNKLALRKKIGII